MPWRVETGTAASAENIMEQGSASPVWFAMGTTIVEPTFFLRESFTRGPVPASLSTRTLTAHEADTHLLR